MTAYCMKCGESREMQEAEQVTMKNGRPDDPRQVRRVRDRDV